MSKQIRTLIIVSVAVVVLIGLLLALLFLIPAPAGTDSSSTTVSSDTSISLISKNKQDGKTVEQPVKSAVIKTETEEFKVVLNSENSLIVENYADLPVASSTMTSLSTSLSSLTATRKVADTSDKMADYGFDNPAATATVTYHDDTTLTIELGAASPAADGYYLRVSGDDAIYLVSTTDGETLLKGSTAYIGTAVITAPVAKSDDTNGKAVLRDMKLTGTVRAGQPVAFRINTDTDKDKDAYSYFQYRITSPYVNGLGSTADTIVSAATTLTASSVAKAHPSDADLETYGLKNPYSICELSLAVQSTTSTTNPTGTSSTDSTATTYYNVATHTIKLGKQNEEGLYYALVDDYKAVYLVSASSVPWAKVTYNDVVSQTLFMINITDLSSITFEQNDTATKFDLEHFPDKEERDDQMKVTVNGTTYPTPDFRTLYQVFMSVNRYGAADAAPTGNPAITLTITPTNTSVQPTVIKFYENTASTYICVLSNGDTFAVRASSVKTMLNQYNNYMQGKAVSAN